MKAKLTAAISILMIPISCSGPDGQDTAVGATGEEPGPSLYVTGEIGVELGDSNYVFGIIQDADFSPDGTIAVLDSQKKRVRVYSPEGEFLGSFGGEGEAPGEFLNPRSIACLEDGRVAVSDPFSREVEIFEPDYTHSETVSDFTERAPFVITATDRGFAGEQGGFQRDEGKITSNLVSWDLSGDSITVLASRETNFSPENIANRFMQPQAGLASSGAILYYSPPETEEYVVYHYDLNSGEEISLSFPGYSPESKSQAELLEETQAFEDRLQAMASSGRGRMLAQSTYEPPEHYYATSSVGVDSQGRIWVQRGWEQTPTFDLFLPGETVPSETVSVSTDEDLSGYTFVVTPYGTAAFEQDPLYYPRILLLEVR